MTDLKKIAIVMSEKDNIAIAKKNIKKGTTLKYLIDTIKISGLIPQGHRFALKNIKTGEEVRQYGYIFGISKGIKKGQIIGRENIREYTINYEKAIEEIFKNKIIFAENSAKKNISGKTFLGYKRTDGRIGTRNFFAIVPTSLCASDTAAKIADAMDNDKSLKKKYRNIDGFVAATHTEGCGCNDGDIIDRLLLTLKNTIIHPNVGGAIVIDLGCEKTNRKVVQKYLGNLKKYEKPVDFVSIQDSGGTGKTILKSKEIILKRLKEVNNIKRKKVPIKHLVVGTECGASDSFSGITANPLIGKTVDKIIGAGGSAILSEIPEMMGAEINLIKRMTSKEVAKKFINGLAYYKNLAKKLNISMEGNFVPGNEKGGLVNPTLKSLGAILKGGETKIVDFLDYAKLIKKKGLNIMNGPGNDLESMTGIAASGANMILFSTGMGATEGNLIVPVIKISTRTETYKKMKDDIDFNAGQLLDKNISQEDLSNELLDMVTDVASGKKTRAEFWKKRSFQIWTAGKLSL
ncbi:MAG: altronate dehydratase family protein [Elusimicrobiota bacterium]